MSTPRVTWFAWYEAKVGPQRVVTATDGGAAPKELTPLEHVRACLRMDEAAAEGDKRPTLVYFHWPHEHPVHGATTLGICTKVLDEEVTARWGMLFRCVQVDMGASDARLIELLGDVQRPTILVLDADAKAVTRVDPSGSPTKMQKALREALTKFPDAWKGVQREVADQDKVLEQARRLAKDDKYADALALVRKVTMSKVRIGPAFDKAMMDTFDWDERLARQKEKEQEKRR